MSDPAGRASHHLGAAQTILLIVFAGVYTLNHGVLLVASRGVDLAANVACAAGIALLLAAVLTLGRTAQVAPEPKAGSQLVERGLYRHLRHPIYTGIVITVVGLFLKKPTLVVGVASGVVIVFLLVKVRVEERLLSETYPGYADYRRRTWGVVPPFGRGS